MNENSFARSGHTSAIPLVLNRDSLDFLDGHDWNFPNIIRYHIGMGAVRASPAEKSCSSINPENHGSDG